MADTSLATPRRSARLIKCDIPLTPLSPQQMHNHQSNIHHRTAALSGFGQTMAAPTSSTPSASVATMRKSHRRTRSVDAASAKSALNVCLRVRPLLGSERPTDPPMQYNATNVIAPSVCHNTLPTPHTTETRSDTQTYTYRALE